MDDVCLYNRLLTDSEISGLADRTGAGVNCRYTLGTQLISQERRTDGNSSTWTASYYGHDGLGSTRALYNGSGVATDTYNYTAYGKMLKILPESGGTVNNYLFAGEQWDPDIKLYYNRARYLNIDSGRFTSRDTLGSGPGDLANLHRYLYVGNDPINHLDPSGLNEISVVGQLNNFSLRAGLFVINVVAKYPKSAFIILCAISATGIFDGFPPGELTPIDELAAWGRFLRLAPGATSAEVAIARKYIGSLQFPFFNKAVRRDYAKTFFEAFPKLNGQVWVHHAVEQQVLERYPGVVTEIEINSIANLRGVPNAINAEVHLSKIRRLWDEFYLRHPKTCTKQDLLDYAKKIDDLFGDQFSLSLR
jgi:RHS repeat-associated protein